MEGRIRELFSLLIRSLEAGSAEEASLVVEHLKGLFEGEEGGRIRKALEAAWEGRWEEVEGDSVALLTAAFSALARGDKRRAVQFLERVLSAPSPIPEAYQLKALLSFSSGRLDEAEKAVSEYERAGGDLAWCSYMRGRIRAERGQIHGAIECFERAVKESPNDATFLSFLAWAKAEAGEREEARKLAERAASANPASGLPHMVMGMIELGEGRVEQAIEAMRKWCEASPFDPDAWLSLAKAYIERGGEGDLEMAKECAERARELDPDYSEVWAVLGLIAEAQGEIGRAKECFDRALALEPGNIDSLEAVARAHLSRGEWEKLAEVCRKLVEADPEEPAYRQWLGLALEGMGRLEEAAKVYEEILSMPTLPEEDRPLIYEGLIEVLSRLGEEEKASEYLSKLIEESGVVKPKGEDEEG